MIWPSDVSFEGYSEKKRKWYSTPNHFIGDTPIPAQYALDLIFKTLIDDEENLEYLTTIPESAEQTNSIMLDMILQKYSRKYRKYLKFKCVKRSVKMIYTIVAMAVAIASIILSIYSLWIM